MCCDKNTPGSNLRQTKLQSSALISSTAATLVDGVESVLAVIETPRSRNQLFQLTNVAAAGAILTSFRATGYTVDAAGNEFQIGAGGGLVTVDAAGVETAANLATAPKTLIKDRLAGCGQTRLAEVPDGADNRLQGDTGAAGNSYILELHKSEYGFEAADQCQDQPCFIVISATAEGAGGLFAMASVQSHLEYNTPPATNESVA